MKIAFVRARYSAHGGAERFAARAVAMLGTATHEQIDVSILARRWDERGLDGPARTHVVRLAPFYLGSTWRDASFARAVLDHSEHVYILGYGFDQNNSERLALHEYLRNTQGRHNVFYTNFEDHGRINRRASQLCFGNPDSSPVSGPYQKSTRNVYQALALDFEALD